MGRSHALSGVAAWLGACAATAGLGHRPAPATAVIGAVVCAGFALVPDLDHPESLASGTYGPATRLLSAGVERVAVAVHHRTAAVGDRRVDGGHRTLTHTAASAVTVGAVVALLAGLGGRWGVGGVVFAAVGLALRGLLPARDRRAAGPLTLTAVAALAALSCAWLPADTWAWLGLPAAVGCLAHLLGDALTHAGVPLLWPIPIRGQRWYRVGTPQVLRFATGGPVEAWLIAPALCLGAAVAGWLTLAP